MSWLAEGKTQNNGLADLRGEDQELEAWMIKRVSQTNFFIAGRAIDKNEYMKDGCSQKISAVFESISNLIEESLEKEWIRLAKYQ